jgi:hypothetical protein
MLYENKWGVVDVNWRKIEDGWWIGCKMLSMEGCKEVSLVGKNNIIVFVVGEVSLK